MPREYDPNEAMPDVHDIALMMQDAYRADGVKLNVSLIVDSFLKDLKDVDESVRATGEPGVARFVIPDLWHVTKGDAADLPKGDADRLLEAWYFGHRLARKFFTPDPSGTCTYHGYPAMAYSRN